MDNIQAVLLNIFGQRLFMVYVALCFEALLESEFFVFQGSRNICCVLERSLGWQRNSGFLKRKTTL